MTVFEVTMEITNHLVFGVLLMVLGSEAGRFAAHSKRPYFWLFVGACSFWLVTSVGQKLICMLYK